MIVIVAFFVLLLLGIPYLHGGIGCLYSGRHSLFRYTAADCGPADVQRPE